MSAARIVTDLLQPRNTLVAGLTALGAGVSGTWAGALWGFFAALCAGVVPAGYVEWERKRGRWGDRHVVDRAKRPPIFAVILGSIALGTVVMVLWDAPRDVLTGMLALWTMTVGLLAVNTFWKISVDCAVASAVVTMLATVQSPRWVAAYPLVIAVCWTRVALRYHTVGQAVAGACLGLATVGAWLL